MTLKIPKLLRPLIYTNRWLHPGHDKLKEAVPFIRDPIEFPGPNYSMDFSSLSLSGQEEPESHMFFEYRSTKTCDNRDLPWIDIDLSIFVVVNKIPGDDVGLVMDYRTNHDDPRVVGNDWHSKHNGCIWREVAPSFTSFCELLGILPNQ